MLNLVAFSNNTTPAVTDIHIENNSTVTTPPTMLTLLETGIKQGVGAIESELALRQEYVQMADSIFNILQESVGEPTDAREVFLNNGDMLLLQNSGENINISCNGAQVIIQTTQLSQLQDIFVNDFYDNPDDYQNSSIKAYIDSLAAGESGYASALPTTSPHNDATATILSKADILAKHQQVDALYARFNVAQPCYLGATYLLQKIENPAAYELPDLLNKIAVRGEQIDFGVFFDNGVTENILIGDIKATRYYSVFEKESLYLEAQAHDIIKNIDLIQQTLVTSYPDGCILKTGGGNGHYNYYDTKNNIFYSGGAKGLESGSSGIPFKDYMNSYFSNANVETRETLTVTDHTPHELADTLQAMMNDMGISVEELLTWK